VHIGVSDLRELLYNLELIEQHVVFGVAGYDLIKPLLVNAETVIVLAESAAGLKLNLKAVGAGDEAGVLPVALHAHLIDIMVSQLGVVYLNAVPGSDDAGAGVGYLRELINSLLSLVERVSGGALGVRRLVVGGVGTSLRLVSVSLSVSGVVERLSCGALGGGGVLGCLLSGLSSLVCRCFSLVCLVRSGTSLVLKLVEGGLDSLGNKAYSIGAGVSYLTVVGRGLEEILAVVRQHAVPVEERAAVRAADDIVVRVAGDGIKVKVGVSRNDVLSGLVKDRRADYF
jgi:hypothetical protein